MEVETSREPHLVNSLELQPVQAELRVSFSLLHAEHWFSMQQVVEGTLGAEVAQGRSEQLLSFTSLSWN